MTANNKPQRRVMVQGLETGVIAAVLVYATFPTPETAMSAGRNLVEARLAGCINILPGMTSIYVWKGQTEIATEAVLIAKTTTERAEGCMAAILAEHPYDTPAVLAIPVLGGSAGYLDWIISGTTSKTG